MVDAALVKQCADPALTPAIVEQFVAQAGSEDPLAVTVKSDGRLVLIPKPATAEDAMEVIRSYVGQAFVRAGLTQMPVGIGFTDPSELTPDLFVPCENLRAGTALFAKVARIVTKWYGHPTNKELFPQMFDDAIYAWKTGNFEGSNIFRADDPGGPTFFQITLDAVDAAQPPADGAYAQPEDAGRNTNPRDIDTAGIRIDLSRIGGQR
jgi:hypothetical protein